MTNSTLSLAGSDITPRATQPVSATWLQSLARKWVLSGLNRLNQGSLILEENGHQHRFGVGAPEYRVFIQHPEFWPQLAFGGSVGAGEAFMAGDWQCDDLTGLLRLLLRNRAVLDGMETGLARISAPLRSQLHWLNRNTRAGSRRNIAAHYDLGNDFYRLWLDETLMYSCAIFDQSEMSLHATSLHAASTAKLERICQKLDLKPGDHVLEIGTGWGGFALHAASHYGCRVTTTTLSRQQFDLARQRIEAAGLNDRVELLLSDYRDLTGQYDKLVSVEMVEAVGAAHLQTYFKQCARLLKPDGIMFLQAITIADQRYSAALKSVDFIQKHIFPGGFLPSVTALTQSMTQAGDLRTVHLEDIGPHYAKTLACWRDNFLANIEAVRDLGYSPDFIRMWLFYLSYCEAGFVERDIGTVQMLLAKPGWRGKPVLGAVLGSSRLYPFQPDGV
jgi:cyclopropane-fatty-acyl-phospholipid synthase